MVTVFSYSLSHGCLALHVTFGTFSHSLAGSVRLLIILSVLLWDGTRSSFPNFSLPLITHVTVVFRAASTTQEAVTCSEFVFAETRRGLTKLTKLFGENSGKNKRRLSQDCLSWIYLLSKKKNKSIMALFH